jgi:hypothetical protein
MILVLFPSTNRGNFLLERRQTSAARSGGMATMVSRRLKRLESPRLLAGI